MLSKNRISFIISLQKKKIRDEQNLFIVEGDKLVREFLSSDFKIISLIAKPEFIGDIPEKVLKNTGEVESVNYEELKRLSSLKTPHNAIAIVQMPKTETRPAQILKELCVALDFVQDPGNLGTIIRAATWFGIKNIVCSEDCVDVYNPKVIQATMGAILNVKVHYYDIKKFLGFAVENGTPVYGTMVEGESIYSHKLSNKGVILLGNESKGIPEGLLPYVTSRLMIPKFTAAKHGIDSLNVGMAASIIFSEFARRSGR
jgi:RNA methyltransferase, TrmH family